MSYSTLGAKIKDQHWLEEEKKSTTIFNTSFLQLKKGIEKKYKTIGTFIQQVTKISHS